MGSSISKESTKLFIREKKEGIKYRIIQVLSRKVGRISRAKKSRSKSEGGSRVGGGPKVSISFSLQRSSLH
jgi:hypothetical protein